ncbi:hypothetical protein J8J14_23510 [Roseomonas sp. SSH11]|uniref:Uncharacterized protein n=1 Tax=Pararoseomonas baculiformis TaxID=2820812 RepID=A0ABS4AL20_9PROT|nr:hypothetical protein [Pararoseomonas baculiformis]MBP0447723.1 hypothetical protein [Pararoseomonas baculiformis]
MTADDDAIGPDGYVRLRCYVPLQDTTFFSLFCSEPKGCGRVASSSVGRAISLMGGDGNRTTQEFAARLRCAECGNRRIEVRVSIDPRTHETRLREGLLSEVRDGDLAFAGASGASHDQPG